MCNFQSITENKTSRVFYQFHDYHTYDLLMIECNLVPYSKLFRILSLSLTNNGNVHIMILNWVKEKTYFLDQMNRHRQVSRR